MKELEAAGLSGAGRIVVHTPEMVKRYNDCLEDIGIEPSGLTEFSIDGMGWSPEIAEEKGDHFYLSHGAANQFAIILTPRQSGKPLYFPFYSFSREMITRFFDAHLSQIADITRDTAIWLDMEQNISHYRSPADLMLLDALTMRTFTVGRIMEAFQHQRSLIRRFMKEEEAWFDADIRREIIASARKYGDMRRRSVEIPDIRFEETRCFHTMAFGGVYLFRDVLRKEKSLLILENKAQFEAMDKAGETVFQVRDSSLVMTLMYEGLVRLDPFYYRNRPEDLELRRESLFVETLAWYHPEIRYHELTEGRKKGFAREMESHLPETFFELERLAKQLSNGQYSFSSALSSRTTQVLMYPHPNLPEPVQRLVWRLITEIDPTDVIALYTYNKKRFFELYPTWPKVKREWVAGLLGRRG